MGPDRKRHQVSVASRRSQAGITVIGFLILAALFGVVGFGALKVMPMYLSNMRLDTILDDLQTEFEDGASSPANIRTELNRRFIVEGIRVPREDVTIEQGRDGYNVRVHLENRAAFISDIYFLVIYDREVTIRR
jgi:hypothetical protein